MGISYLEVLKKNKNIFTKIDSKAKRKVENVMHKVIIILSLVRQQKLWSKKQKYECERRIPPKMNLIHVYTKALDCSPTRDRQDDDGWSFHSI